MKHFVYLLLLILISCSTDVKKTRLPPQVILNEQVESSKEYTIEEDWSIQYLGAMELAEQGKTTEACENFKNLLNENDFPLNDLVLLRYAKYCMSSSEIADIETKLLNSPSWMLEDAVDFLIEYHKRQLAGAELVQLIEKKLPYLKIQSEKENYIKSNLSFLKTKKETEQFKKLEERLFEISPRLNPKSVSTDFFSGGRDFERNRNYERARHFYEKMIKDKTISNDDKLEAQFRIAKTYKSEKNIKKYFSEFRKLISQIKKIADSNDFYNRKLVDYSFQLARAIWSAQEEDKAITILYEVVISPDTLSEEVAQAYSLIGKIFHEKKDYYHALNSFEKALLLSRKGNLQNEEFLWDLSWSYFLSKNYTKSEKYFNELITTSSDTSIANKASFWLARVYKNQKKDADASALLTQLAIKDSWGYYGLMAQKELGINYSLITSKPVTRYEVPVYEWLKALKEYKYAGLFIDQIDVEDLSANDAASVLSFYAEINQSQKSLQRFFKLSPEKRIAVQDLLPQISYPSPYLNEVKDAANESNLTPALIYAVIRQESGFNPYAKSAADAFGLMQLLPAKGAEVAKTLKIPFPNHEALYDEKINIRFGAHELARLRKEAQGDFILTVAPYNADIKAVKKWVIERFNGDPLINIEQIPYQETQGYVKLVLRNYLNYKRILETTPFPFPPELLKSNNY